MSVPSTNPSAPIHAPRTRPGPKNSRQVEPCGGSKWVG